MAPPNAERLALNFGPGATVRVWQKIKEGDKTRLQAFEGLVIARKHGREPGATFIVRKMSGDVGVEKTFPLYSPVIDRIEVLRTSRVRRAKLYYTRDKSAREIRRKMKQAEATIEAK
ncbi:MAG: 50S ribosomal protein L19 [Patescibacteria group bacterium]|mgnify:FL=1